MSNLGQRIPVHAGDPDGVFVLFAKLLADYAVYIERDVADIVKKAVDPDFANAGARGYVGAIGSNIPDETIKVAVKNLARSKFKQAGLVI